MSVWDGLHQTHAIEAIANAVGRGEMPASWLLVGPPGSGKGAVALAMAAALECTEQPGQGCGRCRACARVMRGSFPDVHRIEAEGTFIRVEVVREEVIPEASRSPYEGPFKVFIFYEAERMNPSAQNALLKTLEEPVPDTVFILLTDQEEELLETIRSRCRLVRLNPLSPEQVRSALIARGAAPEAADLAVSIAGGDLERAYELAVDPQAAERRDEWLSLCDRIAAPADGLEAAAGVLATAGKAVKLREKEQKKELSDLVETTGEGRGTAAARTALVNRHKRELKRLETEVVMEALDVIAGFYRDVVAVRGDAASEVSNPDRMPDLERWARSDLPSATLLFRSERCLAGAAALKKNSNPLLTLEAVFSAASSAGVRAR
jgi:DNA polymerase III subunit delta'